MNSDGASFLSVRPCERSARLPFLSDAADAGTQANTRLTRTRFVKHDLVATEAHQRRRARSSERHDSRQAAPAVFHVPTHQLDNDETSRAPPLGRFYSLGRSASRAVRKFLERCAV